MHLPRPVRLSQLVVVSVAVLTLGACQGSAVSGDDDEAASPAATGDDSEASSDPSSDSSGTAEADGEPIRVGLVNPVTGPYAALGEDVNDGFQLYVDDHDGMLAGHPIEVLTEDTANDANVAQEAVTQLVDDDVDLLAGFVNSGVMYAAAGAVVDSGVPLVITTAGADDLTQRDAADNIFRVSYTSSQDAMPLGEYACTELGYETMALVGLDYSFGWEAASGFAMAYEDAGCDVVQEVYAALGSADWAPFVQQIDTDAADAVWAVIPGSDGIRFMEAYRDFGVDLPLIGHGATTDEQILSEQQDLADGVITSLHYSAAITDEANQDFVERFESSSGRSVSQYAENGWATAQVLEAALGAIDGPVTSEALVDAIGEVSIEAPRGPLAFDEYGQAVDTVYIRQVVEADGVWINEVIDAYPDTSQFWTYDPDEFLAGTPLAERKGTWE